MSAEVPQRIEPIRPATASSPAEALALLCEALSDGDVEAAACLYEPNAVVSLTLGDPCGASPLEEALSALASMKLAVEVAMVDAVMVNDLALVLASRSLVGLTSAGARASATGQGAVVLRKGPGEAWRFVADHWGLERSRLSPLAPLS